MNNHLLDFDRILLVLFAVLLFRFGWQLYAPTPSQVEEDQSVPASTLETSLPQGLPTLL